MTPAGEHFALIGRSYPCEVFELWFQVSLTARERRKSVRMSEANRTPVVPWTSTTSTKTASRV